MQHNFNAPHDRRRRSDIVTRLVTAASVIGWIMISICAALTIYAKPEQTNLFYEIFNIPTRNYWNYSLLNMVFFLLIGLLAVSLIGIMMNAMRHRRKTDRFKKSLIFQAIMSVFGMLLLILNSFI